MKKILAILVVGLVAGAAMASTTTVITNAYNQVVTFVSDGQGVHVTSVVPLNDDAPSEAGMPGAVVASEATVDNKYVAVGPDKTTPLMVQAFSGTIAATGLATNTFTVAFGAAPTVVWGQTENPAGAITNYTSTISATQVIVKGRPSKTYAGIAVGARP